MTSRCLVISFDENYYKYATVLLQSFADNYSKPIDVVCIVPQELLKNEKTLNLVKTKLTDADNLNIIFRSSNHQEVKTAELDWKPAMHGHLSEIIFDRVWIAEICHEYDEAVYVDVDCLFLRDATKLIHHPIVGQSKIIALPESSSIAEEELGLPERAYFNNGVFVTDLNYWRENNLGEKMTEWLLTQNAGSCPEQNAMNVFLYDVWSPLSVNFNYADGYGRAWYEYFYQSPTLVHFLGPIKPWNDVEFDNPDPQNRPIYSRGIYDKDWKALYKKIWESESFTDSTL